MIDVVLLVGLGLFALAGIVLAGLQLPGAWLTLAAAAAYDWHYGWARIGWPYLAAMAALAAIGEVVETFAAAAIARRAGASRRATIGAVVGGLLGMVFLSLPMPIIGTIAGGLIGCFLGAMAGELSRHDDLERGARVGFFAALGRILGMMVKTAVAVTIAAGCVSLAVW